MQNKGISTLAVLLIILGVVLVGGCATYYYTAIKPEQNQPKEVACTMEAKLCPDGSAVGRTGPSCEFAPCPDQIVDWQLPNPNADWKTYTNNEYGFEIKYPDNFSAEELPSPATLLYLRLKGEGYENTGLDYAQIVADTACVSGVLGAFEEININNQIFKRYTQLGDHASGGQRGGWYTYRTTKNNICLNIEAFLAYHDTRGYTDQPRWLEQSQIDKIFEYFENIVLTFKFIN